MDSGPSESWPECQFLWKSSFKEAAGQPEKYNFAASGLRSLSAWSDKTSTVKWIKFLNRKKDFDSGSGCSEKNFWCKKPSLPSFSFSNFHANNYS